MLNVAAKMLQFLMNNKKYWLLPIILIFVLSAGLLILAKTSDVAPFLYSLF